VLVEIQGLTQLLPDCKIQHVGQAASAVAHELAKRTLEREEWMVMRDGIPLELRRVVILSNYIEMTHYKYLNAILLTCNQSTSSFTQHMTHQ
jgi:hypothetical protein